MQRENFYSRGSYDLSGNTVLTADLLLGHTLTNARFFPNNNLGNITIAANNAYLPAQIQNEMLADHLSTFTLGRIDTDFPEIANVEEAWVEQLQLGARGTIGSIWSWDASASYGATERSIKFEPEEIIADFANAVNAVISPTTGQPVCAIALTNPSTNCVPVNLFGQGSPSQAAQNYFLGNTILKMDLTHAGGRGQS